MTSPITWILAAPFAHSLGFARLAWCASCVLLFGAGCANTTDQQGRARSADEPIFVDAVTLRREFEENEIRAEQKYTGRSVVVAGIIDRIGEDLLGHGYITFTGETMFNVQAMFEDKAELISMSPGQRLVVRCQEVDGGNILGVLLRTCTAPAGLQVPD